MSDKPIVLHLGNGYFASWRGSAPTRNPDEAMQFSSNEQCAAWAIREGYVKAATSRMYLPDEQRMPNQFEKGA
jgi:hypothetical protein